MLSLHIVQGHAYTVKKMLLPLHLKECRLNRTPIGCNYLALMGILEILKGWYTGTPQGVLHLMYYVHGYLKILLLRNCYQFAKTSTLCTTRLQKMIKEKYARTNYTSVLPVHTNI